MLHLTAFDAEDLGVISAQMQDAVIRFADVSYLKRQRRRTGVSIDDVTRVQRQGPQGLGDLTVLSLLALSFAPAGGEDNPGGTITMTFSGGHVIALEVACIDVSLDDLGPAWSTEKTPEHGA